MESYLPRKPAQPRNRYRMSQTLIQPLAISVVGCLMNKVKLSMKAARKNKLLAEKLETTIQLLSE